MTGAGVQAVVTDKLNDILLRAVTSNAKFSDLTRELHEHLTTNENKQGALSKYANTYATTAMSQYVGENNRLLTNDLGLEWFEYVGSNIETTREFCDHLTEKRYVHKSEIKTILKGEIDGHQCEIYEKTGLPKGMIEGTNEQNFQVNCGGWNCRHQLVPVAKEAVPLDIRAKFEMQETSAPKQAGKRVKTADEKRKIQERWTQRRLNNMESELSNNLTKEEKKAIAENNLEIENTLGVTKGQIMNYEKANKGKENPNYITDKSYQVNCQTCTLTHTLRRLGFNVEAQPNINNSAFNELQKQGLDWKQRFMNTDGSKVDYDFSYNWAIRKGYKTMTKGRLNEYIEEKIQDDGLYEVYCIWKKGGAHVFCAEKKGNNIKFFDPQTGAEDVKHYIDEMMYTGTGIIRIDNKLINPKTKNLFLVKNP